MRPLEAAFLENIDAIYATVLDASKWPEALDRTAAVAGAFGTILMVTDPVVRDLEITVLSEKIGDAEARTYVRSKLSDDEFRWDEALDLVPALTILSEDQIWPDRAAYDVMASVKWLRWGARRGWASRRSTNSTRSLAACSASAR